MNKLQAIKARLKVTADSYPSWVTPVEKVFLTNLGRAKESPKYDGDSESICFKYKQVNWAHTQLQHLHEVAKKYDLTLEITAEANLISVTVFSDPE